MLETILEYKFANFTKNSLKIFPIQFVIMGTNSYDTYFLAKGEVSVKNLTEEQLKYIRTFPRVSQSLVLASMVDNGDIFWGEPKLVGLESGIQDVDANLVNIITSDDWTGPLEINDKILFHSRKEDGKVFYNVLTGEKEVLLSIPSQISYLGKFTNKFPVFRSKRAHKEDGFARFFMPGSSVTGFDELIIDNDSESFAGYDGENIYVKNYETKKVKCLNSGSEFDLNLEKYDSVKEVFLIGNQRFARTQHGLVNMETNDFHSFSSGCESLGLFPTQKGNCLTGLGLFKLNDSECNNNSFRLLAVKNLGFSNNKFNKFNFNPNYGYLEIPSSEGEVIYSGNPEDKYNLENYLYFVGQDSWIELPEGRSINDLGLFNVGSRLLGQSKEGLCYDLETGESLLDFGKYLHPLCWDERLRGYFIDLDGDNNSFKISRVQF